MRRIQLKVEYRYSFSRRMLNKFRRGISVGLAFALFISMVIFIKMRLLSLSSKSKQVSTQMESLNSEMRSIQAEFGNLELSERLQHKWQYGDHRRFVRMCENNKDAQKRIFRLGLNEGILIDELSVVSSSKFPAGFDFSIQITGDYDQILRFQEILELEFTLLKIKKVQMRSKFAEDRYEGLLHFSIYGWFW